MDERPDGGPELPGPGPDSGPDEPSADDSPEDPAGPADPAAPVIGLPATGPAAEALAEEAAEIRRMIDAGAGSPEAIRELAARLREHRAREEALWRTEVKPALVKEGRGRFRGHRKAGDAAAPEATKQSQATWLGVLMLALVAVVIVAANTSVWVLLLPVLALLVFAWYQGRQEPPA